MDVSHTPSPALSNPRNVCVAMVVSGAALVLVYKSLFVCLSALALQGPLICPHWLCRRLCFRPPGMCVWGLFWLVLRPFPEFCTQLAPLQISSFLGASAEIQEQHGRPSLYCRAFSLLLC